MMDPPEVNPAKIAPEPDPDDAMAAAAEATIAAKDIGDRIKHLRQRKGMGLVELGRHTGLSASFLSQLETGRVVPTLRNLARIAMVFSRDISFFFEPEREEVFRIVRASERTRLPQTGADLPGYFFENLSGGVANGQDVAPYVAEFLPADGKRSQREHEHAGAEFLYVLSGCLQITHGERTETFAAGDAVYFQANVKHSYQRVGDEVCEALILTLPEPARAARNGNGNGVRH
jgi:transcriptional regulator with XRE-family HTH domain